MIKKKYKHYEKVLGINKKEVISIMGDEFNHFPDNIWTYCLRKNWLGKKTFLIIYFENNKVTKIRIERTYGDLRKFYKYIQKNTFV